jgi:glucosamine kinase
MSAAAEPDVPFFLGIDGGATRTTALVTDADGVERARLSGETAIVQIMEPEQSAGIIADIARRALAEAGGAGERAAVLCCAITGAGREPERTQLEQALGRLGLAERVVVTTDAQCALQDAFGDGPGILLIAGTGSIGWGRAPDGRTDRVGGWGWILGDEGSGYAIGLAALHAVVHADDGRGPETSLTADVLRATGAPITRGLVTWAAQASKADVGALAPLVFAAEASDPVAAGILDRATADLALHVSALHQRLGPWPGPAEVAFSGGLIAPGGPLRERLRGALVRLPHSTCVLERPVDGARGAAALARRALGLAA